MDEIRFAGAFGPGAENAAAQEIVRKLAVELVPLLVELAQITGWGAVLDALHTIIVNVGVREFGIERVRTLHQAAIEALPAVAQLAARDGTAGSA